MKKEYIKPTIETIVVEPCAVIALSVEVGGEGKEGEEADVKGESSSSRIWGDGNDNWGGVK